MASAQNPINSRTQPLGAAGFGPRTQRRESRLVAGPALLNIQHETSGCDDEGSTTGVTKAVDYNSVINPRVEVIKLPQHSPQSCTLHSKHSPIHHEPTGLSTVHVTHNTHNHKSNLHNASLTPTQTPTVVCVRTTLHTSSPVLKPLVFSNKASELAKHKQIYKWSAERVLNRTDLSWSRSRMPTLAPLLDMQHLEHVRDAVLTKFTAGTVLESVKGDHSFWVMTVTICQRWRHSLCSLSHRVCQQLLQNPPERNTTVTSKVRSRFVLSCANPRPCSQLISKY